MNRRIFSSFIGALTFGWIKPVGAARLFGKRYKVPPTFWYENAAGEKWVPDENHFRTLSDAPEGFIYQRSQFPCYLHESCCTREGRIFSGSSGWSEDLVFAMAHDGYKLSEAILIVAGLCERCMNAAASDYRLSWGYARYSEQWQRSNTICDVCRVAEGE